MILNIRLKNFKQHDSLELDFTNGVNTITGENFAGKSSILHALLYGWWGASAVPGGMKVVQKRGTQGHEVLFDWKIAADVYTIRRTSSICNLWKNGKDDESLIATGASAVAKKLTEIFGMDRAEFCDIKYSEQKKAEQMLTLGASRVHALIEKVTDVETVNNVIDRLKTEVQRTETLVESMPDQDIEEFLNTRVYLSNKLKEDEPKLYQSQSDMDFAESTQKELADQLSDLKTRQGTLVSAVDQYRRINSQLNEKGSQRDEAVAQLNNRPQIPSTQTLDAEIAALESEISEVESTQLSWQSYKTEVSGKQSVISQYESSVEQTQEKIASLSHVEIGDDLDEKARRIESDLLEAKDAINQTSTDLGIVKAKIAELVNSKENSVCHSCHRPFEGKDVEKVESDLAAKRKELESLNSLMAEQQELVDTLELQQESTAAQIRSADELSALENTLAEQKLQLQQYKDELEHIREPATPEVPAEQMAQKKSKLNSLRSRSREAAVEEVTVKNLQEKVSRLQNEITQLNVDINQLVEKNQLTKDLVESDHTPLKDEISAVQEKMYEADSTYRTARTTYNDLTGAIAANKEKLQHIEEKIIQANQVKEDKKKLLVRSDRCQQLLKFLRTNKDNFLSEVWRKITGYATSVALTCTGGKITEINRTKDGKFEYWEDGEVFPVEAASGAQRSIMGLGVQLALSEMLPSSLEALMLDEPTADMSETVSLALATLLSKSDNQILMISHRELDGAVSDNAIHL